jgi:hypothetical protein
MRPARRWRTAAFEILAVSILLCADVATVAGQTPPHTGGLTPFRYRHPDPRVSLAVLEQDDCPVRITSADIEKSDKRSNDAPFRLQFTARNVGDAPLRSFRLTVWVFDPAGELKGVETVPGLAPLGIQKSKKLDYLLRTISVNDKDRILIAVHEVGDESGGWREDLKALEAAAREFARTKPSR